MEIYCKRSAVTDFENNIIENKAGLYMYIAVNVTRNFAFKMQHSILNFRQYCHINITMYINSIIMHTYDIM